MYNYTTETILNTLTDTGGKSRVEAIVADNALFVRRVNKYSVPSIVGSKIYRHSYEAPVKPSTKIALGASLTAGATYRIALEITLNNSNLAEYARPRTQDKGKIFYYEFVPATGETAAQSITKVYNQIVTQQIRFDDKKFDVSKSNAELTITGISPKQRIKSLTLEKANTQADGHIIFETVATDVTTTVIAAGKEGFGDWAWITANLRLLTTENTRPFGLNVNDQSEMPVPGGQYTQYSFQTSVDRGVMGTGVVGHQATSITNHVFYVLSTIKTAFEAELEKLTDIVDTPLELVEYPAGTVILKYTAV